MPPDGRPETVRGLRFSEEVPMRTGLYDIEALGREPARVRDTSISATLRRAKRRAAHLGTREADERGRELDGQTSRSRPPGSR
jgi:hypothetical protein